MTFQQLTFVVEAARCMSINKAAERLYTHQSNVSNVIRQLEGELGIQIFQRTKKGVLVTEEGREFLNYAEEILDRVGFIEEVYSVRARQRKHYFSVSSMRSYFLSVPTMRLYDHMSDSGPDPVYIRLKRQTYHDVMDDVQCGRSDLGVAFILRSQNRKMEKYCHAKNLECFHLGDTRMHVLVREGHPILSQSDPLKSITDYPYLIIEEQENFGRYYDEFSRSILQLFQKAPKYMISVNDSNTGNDIIAYTDVFYISTTPWQHSDHYRFTSIPLPGDENLLSHYYILRKDQATSPFVPLYIQQLKDLFQHLTE